MIEEVEEFIGLLGFIVERAFETLVEEFPETLNVLGVIFFLLLEKRLEFFPVRLFFLDKQLGFDFLLRNHVRLFDFFLHFFGEEI